MDGIPPRTEEVVRPEDILDFWTLYHQNCSACHGENGQDGPAMDLANPVYQSLVDDSSLKKWITGGMPGTEMPAFGESAGGFLTERQVDALVAGMRQNWAKSGENLSGIPVYAAVSSGDAKAGEQVYASACESCHNKPGAQITNPTYLALVSDQALRTITIAGRPDLRHPDWQHARQGQPLTDADVTNVVAYLASLRTPTPGQPYPGRP
ncbi:MAG TPA: cytochrome c [Candidatus Acidoferrum sp.]|nr:cytochrome c [Candidatus Acidoferrum sp.]